MTKKRTVPDLAHELAGNWSITGDDWALAAWVHVWFSNDINPEAPWVYQRACAWWQDASEDQQHAAWALLGLSEYSPASLSEDERLSVPKRVLADLRWVVDEAMKVLTEAEEAK